MENKYQVIALLGKSGAGKDSLQNGTCKLHPLIFHKVVSCTTRPKRDGEMQGEDYDYISVESFTHKLLAGDMLEATEFNEWFYGTPISALAKDKINIGVFNPEGVAKLCADPRVDVYAILVNTDDKTRLMRSLMREENPNCAEICRRFFADEKDFTDLPFDYTILENVEGGALDLLSDSFALDTAIETIWNNVCTDTAFETIHRWDESMRTKAEAVAAEDKVD